MNQPDTTLMIFPHDAYHERGSEAVLAPLQARIAILTGIDGLPVRWRGTAGVEVTLPERLDRNAFEQALTDGLDGWTLGGVVTYGLPRAL